MPPSTETNQQGRGTMLFFARSDAIHWTRKRAEKNAWPSRPNASHACSVVIMTTLGEAATLGRATEHRAQDVVGLADLLRAPPGRDEREDLLGLLAGHRGGLVADVGEVAERDLEGGGDVVQAVERDRFLAALDLTDELPAQAGALAERSEEHTSELQSHHDLVCRLLLEKKKQSKQEGGETEEVKERSAELATGVGAGA